MKICFIGVGIVDAMNGEAVGGAEKQQAMILKGLKSKGVDIVVLEYYLKEPIVIDGIYFYPTWEKDHKSFFSKIKNIKTQLKKHNVNVVYARGTQIYIAFLYFLLKIKKSKLKLFWGIAGDHDLTSKYNYLRVNNVNSLYGKINAGLIFNLSSIMSFYFSDTIICQTQEQMKRCKTISKNRSTIQISNIYTSSLNNEINSDEDVIVDAIWIGKFSGNKGEDILLSIAKDIPEMKIICLGHVTENFKKTKVFQKILKQKNLILEGRVPNNQVGFSISKAKFILNTSPSEGLSNAFLEGWDLEKPVVSFRVNPNEYLTKGKAGYCANGSYNQLIIKLRSILTDRKFINYHGKKGKQILLKNHNTELIISDYKTLFTNK